MYTLIAAVFAWKGFDVLLILQSPSPTALTLVDRVTFTGCSREDGDAGARRWRRKWNESSFVPAGSKTRRALTTVRVARNEAAQFSRKLKQMFLYLFVSKCAFLIGACVALVSNEQLTSVASVQWTGHICARMPMPSN